MSIAPIASAYEFQSEASSAVSVRLERAIQNLNSQQVFGEESEIVLTRDDSSRRLVVQVVNRHTRLILYQLPTATIFQLTNKLAR